MQVELGEAFALRDRRRLPPSPASTAHGGSLSHTEKAKAHLHATTSRRVRPLQPSSAGSISVSSSPSLSGRAELQGQQARGADGRPASASPASRSGGRVGSPIERRREGEEQADAAESSRGTPEGSPSSGVASPTVSWPQDLGRKETSGDIVSSSDPKPTSCLVAALVLPQLTCHLASSLLHVLEQSLAFQASPPLAGPLCLVFPSCLASLALPSLVTACQCFQVTRLQR